MTKPASLLLKAAVAGGIWVTLQATAQAQIGLPPTESRAEDFAAASQQSCDVPASQSLLGNVANANNRAAVLEEQLLAHLQANLPSCQNNVAWLVWAGQTLMKAKQYLLASDYLERALMLSPDNKGAQLDYALALAGSEQPDAALSLVKGLLKEPDMPEPLRASIRGLLARLQAPQNGATTLGGAFRMNGQNAQNANGQNLNAQNFNGQNALQSSSPHKFYAGFKYGRDNNLLGAPNLSELSLNFSGIPFSLSLDSSYLSQSGSYTRADLGWSYSRPLDVSPSPDLAQPENAGLLQAWAQARGRQSPVTPEARQQQALVGVEYRAKPFAASKVPEASQLGSLGTYATAQGVELRGGTSVKYAAQTLGLGLVKASSAWGAKCEAKLGAEWQRRDLVSNPILSGRYQGVAAQWFCQNDEGQALLVAASGGRDNNTDPARAGGAQSESAARLMGRWGAYLVEMEADLKKDSSIYSVLLSDRVRKIARAGARVEWQGSLAAYPDVQLQAGVQWSHQKSNLQLFRQQNWGPYIGISKAW